MALVAVHSKAVGLLLLIHRNCCVALPRGDAVGSSAICDCGNS